MGVAGFIFNGAGRWALVAVPAALVTWLALMPCLERLRPKGSLDAWVCFLAVFIPLFTYLGGHSLWLTAFGERLTSCEVTSVTTHTHRKSPNSYTNDITCGHRELVYTPSWGIHAKGKGERVDLVVDRLGVVLNLEPTKVSTTRNLLVPLAAAWGVGSILLILRLPTRKPKMERRKASVGGDFLQP